jgi:DNA-binding MarR family transcriptional regulator
MTKVLAEDVKLVGRLIQALEELRPLDPEMPIQTILTFLHTAANEGRSMTELSRVLNLPQSTMSRNLTALSELNRHKRPGLDLVSYTYDPMVNAAKKNANLTKKGHALLARMLAPFKR